VLTKYGHDTSEKEEMNGRKREERDQAERVLTGTGKQKVRKEEKEYKEEKGKKR
jgi:hypothetical protein